MKKLIGGIVVATVALAVMVVLPDRAATAQGRQIVTLPGWGASIGVAVRETTAEDAKSAKLSEPAGVVIESVRSSSPAEKAGFQSGDIVVEFDGERVRSVQHFTRLVRETPPSRTVSAVVVRGTSRQTLQVVPEANDFATDTREQLRRFERRGPDAAFRDFNFDFDGGRLRLFGRRPNLGVSLTPLSSQLAEYFGVKEGALVTWVESGTPAAAAGLKAGDVITAIGGRSIANAADVSEAIRRADAADGIDISVTRDRKQLMLKATVPDTRPATPAARRGLPV